MGPTLRDLDACFLTFHFLSSPKSKHRLFTNLEPGLYPICYHCFSDLYMCHMQIIDNKIDFRVWRHANNYSIFIQIVLVLCLYFCSDEKFYCIG